MYPASTKKGAAVSAFPDVCKTPSPGGPVPIPYPNVTSVSPPTTQKATQKATVTGSVRLGTGDEPSTARVTPVQLKSKLATLSAQLMGLPGGNPNQWHTIVDDYVITAAALYISLSDR